MMATDSFLKDKAEEKAVDKAVQAEEKAEDKTTEVQAEVKAEVKAVEKQNGRAVANFKLEDSCHVVNANLIKSQLLFRLKQAFELLKKIDQLFFILNNLHLFIDRENKNI